MPSGAIQQSGSCGMFSTSQSNLLHAGTKEGLAMVLLSEVYQSNSNSFCFVLFLPKIKESYQTLDLHFPELVGTESSVN